MAVIYQARFTDIGLARVGFISGDGTGSYEQSTGKHTIPLGGQRNDPLRPKAATTTDRWCHALVQAKSKPGGTVKRVFLPWGTAVAGASPAFAWNSGGSVLEVGKINNGGDQSLGPVSASLTSFDLSDGEHWFAMRVRIVNDPPIDSTENHQVEFWVDDSQIFDGEISIKDSQANRLLGFQGPTTGGKSPTGFDITVRKVIYVDTSGSDMNGRLDDHTKFTLDTRKPNAQGTLNVMHGTTDDTNKYLNWDNIPKVNTAYNASHFVGTKENQDSNLEDAVVPTDREVKSVSYFMTNLSPDASASWRANDTGLMVNGSLVEELGTADVDFDGTIVPLNHHFGTVTETDFNAVVAGARSGSTQHAIHVVVADLLYGPEAAAAIPNRIYQVEQAINRSNTY